MGCGRTDTRSSAATASQSRPLGITACQAVCVDKHVDVIFVSRKGKEHDEKEERENGNLVAPTTVGDLEVWKDIAEKPVRQWTRPALNKDLMSGERESKHEARGV